MIKNDELKTTGRQRVTIIIIAIFMLLSTFALYATAIMGNGNSNTGKTVSSEKQARFNELYQKYLDAVDAQTAELSKKYFDQFSSYRSRVKAFNAADVDEVVTKDLVVGDGAEVTDKNFVDYSAYYIGWLSNESVFDSSFDDYSKPTSLRAPMPGSTNMIEGWLSGIVGMKIGGVREITIPAELAYGSTEQEDIPANSALKFVVMLIDPVQDPDFEGSAELEQLFDELYPSTY
jgi:FKBP-type peptidyl-prolyl cis-trans isomerase